MEEEKRDPRREAHDALLTEIGVLRNSTPSMPKMGLAMLEQTVRYHGYQVGPERLHEYRARLAVLRRYGEEVERQASTLPPMQAGRLRDFGQVIFAETISFDSLDATKVRAAAAAVRKEIDDARHAEEDRERAQADARLLDEISALSPDSVMRACAQVGVELSLKAGKLEARPAGRLDTRMRRAIDFHRSGLCHLLGTVATVEAV